MKMEENVVIYFLFIFYFRSSGYAEMIPDQGVQAFWHVTNIVQVIHGFH